MFPKHVKNVPRRTSLFLKNVVRKLSKEYDVKKNKEPLLRRKWKGYVKIETAFQRYVVTKPSLRQIAKKQEVMLKEKGRGEYSKNTLKKWILLVLNIDLSAHVHR